MLGCSRDAYSYSDFSPSFFTMQLHYLSLLSAVFSTAILVIAQEVHSNVTYEVRWDFTAPIETTAIKDAYEQAAAKQANLRIQEAVKTVGCL